MTAQPHDKDAAPDRSADAPYDTAVIGGGVVGCAVLRGLTLAGARTVLLEREADILEGASKGNSGLLHCGFDAAPGSLERACMQAGRREYLAIHKQLGLPLLPTGALLVAWTADEAARLDGIVANAAAGGIDTIVRLSRDAVLEREPELAPDAVAGLLVPDESVIDPWSAPLAYALQAIANGASVRRGVRVTGGALSEAGWTLDTNAVPVRARVVVNCAGNYGDIVEAIARPSPFTIHPRKGQFVVFDKTAAHLARAIILPVPNERTKGVVVCPTAFGNLLVGPTAEDQEDRSLATVEQSALQALMRQGVRILPRLAERPVTAVFAGLRPASQFKDYQIEAVPGRSWISVGGIRSTGLTAALGIALHVRALHEQHFGALHDLRDPAWPRVVNLAEALPRPYALPGRSPIVCHCEMVTEAEIRAALSGPLPSTTLGGLRRRTRCMLGRCQGFACTRRVMELAAGQVVELAG